MKKKKIVLMSYSLLFYIITPFQGRIQDFKLGGGAHLEGGAKIIGVFRVKNHDFTPKINFLSNFRGARARIRPCFHFQLLMSNSLWGLIVFRQWQSNHCFSVAIIITTRSRNRINRRTDSTMVKRKKTKE